MSSAVLQAPASAEALRAFPHRSASFRSVSYRPGPVGRFPLAPALCVNHGDKMYKNHAQKMYNQLPISYDDVSIGGIK